MASETAKSVYGSRRRFDGARLRRISKNIVLGASGLALLTVAGFFLHVNPSAIGFAYLLVLLAQSLTGEFLSSAVVAFLAVGCLDYFFIPPVLSFNVSSPVDALAVVSFLATALVVTSLVTKVRHAAKATELQHQNLQRLYQLAQELLAIEPDVESGKEFLKPFQGVFGVRATALYDALTAELYSGGDSCAGLAARTQEAFLAGGDLIDFSRGVCVRCIRLAGKPAGAIGFEGLHDPEVTSGPLTALATALLGRMYAFRHANQAAAAAQAEAYRSVILDALAHEFKTPLSTILAAAGALREAGSLGPEHMEMAETVELEAARLGRLTTRLIRTARLEREEIKPWMELIDISSVVADIVDQYVRLVSDRDISVVRECGATDVLADPELLRLAVSQLLDNACKYSPSGSAITLTISRDHLHVAIRVSSNGNPIPHMERSHIFERFYRGADAKRIAAGTGLGLYVARKIAIAHGGNLELDADQPLDDSTVFRMSIPVSQSETNGVATNG
jgi:two-component system sensor histidine kinase KdpD